MRDYRQRCVIIFKNMRHSKIVSSASNRKDTHVEEDRWIFELIPEVILWHRALSKTIVFEGVNVM